MAKIPVEKESSGGGWGKWIVGLLALALIVWAIWAWGAGGEEEVVAEEGVEQLEEDADIEQPAAGAAAGGVITDLSTITNASGQTFIGRQVQLSNLNVPQMLGDSLFNVSAAGAEGAEEDVLVVLDETTQVEQGGVEGRYNVNEGQRLTVLEGSIEQLASDVLQEEGLTGPDADQIMRENEYYIRAQRIDITAEG